MASRLKLFLVALILTASSIYGFAENTTSVVWQSSQASGKRLKDNGGVADLTPGSSAAGDGAVLQLGYYSGGTSASPFTGTFTALTGEGAVNSAFNTTSIGDAPGGAASRFSLNTTFIEGSATSGASLPSVGIPLVIRIYNAPTVAASSYFNEVSCSATTWQWKAPSDGVGTEILISLSDASLIWKGTAFQTSIALGAAATFTLTPQSTTAPVGGATGSFDVTASDQSANWTAFENDNWLHITSGSSGTGDGTVAYSVDANPGSSGRVGTISAAGKVFTITQAGTSGGQVGFSLSTDFAGYAKTGGSGTFNVIAPSDASAWTAVSNDGWITVTAGAAAMGAGTVKYTVAALAAGAPARTGTITVAGLTFTVEQAATAPTSTLTVSIDGPGTTAGPATSQRIVGKKYTIVAKPASGAYFKGWTGQNVTFLPGAELQTSLSFIMGENATLTAHFAEANPYLDGSTAFTYVGLINGDDPENPAEAGMITLTLTRTGGLSGTVRLGGANYSLKGSLTSTGTTAFMLKRKTGSAIYLGLALDFGTKTISATMNEGDENGPAFGAAMATQKAVYKNNAPYLSSTVGSEAWNSRDLKSRPH